MSAGCYCESDAAQGFIRRKAGGGKLLPRGAFVLRFVNPRIQLSDVWRATEEIERLPKCREMHARIVGIGNSVCGAGEIVAIERFRPVFSPIGAFENTSPGTGRRHAEDGVSERAYHQNVGIVWIDDY